MRDALCPECGSPLSVEVIEDEDTDNIIIRFFCEGSANDVFVLEINTHLLNEDLLDWDDIDTTYKATIKLIERKPDPYYVLDRETMELVEREEPLSDEE